MERIELALEVGPIAPPVVERLKAAGFAVYKGENTWRVIAEVHPDPRRSLTEQARVLAHDILIDFRLDPLHTPPAFTLRDPDAAIETAAGELILEDARRASDPDPLQIHPRKHWWSKQSDVDWSHR